MKEIQNATDIPVEYQGTPVGRLLEYHNLNRPHEKYDRAELLIGMCMDHRKKLNTPEKFAYVLRAGGANFRNNEFKISFAVGVADIKYFVLIGHNHCGMVNLKSKKQNFINGLVENAGWTEAQAEKHFSESLPNYEIEDAETFTKTEAKRLQLKYPKLTVAALFYNVDNNKLYML